MNSEWIEYGLGELFEYRSGLSKPRSDFGSGYDFLSFKDVFYNYFIPEQLSALVRSTEREREVGSVRRGDVFLTRTSETMDELGMSSVALKNYDSATFNGFCKRLRPKNNFQIDPKFSGFYFRSSLFRRAVTAMSSMSTRASLNNGMMDRLTMILPPLAEQERISAVLWGLTAKIELNRKMNRTLEEMAQAIFKSWFIDFDGVPESELVESELGLTPKGWAVKPISEIIRLIGGGTPKRSCPEFWEGTIPWFSVRDAPTSQDIFVLDTESHITDEGLARSSARMVEAWTTIISARGTVGKLALTACPMTFNQSCYGIRSSVGHGEVFVHFAVRVAVRHLQRSAHGSVFDTITRKTFDTVNICVPPIEKAQEFEKQAIPLLTRILLNGRQSRTLSSLRDTLLPKLISGEIRVPEAEQIVAEVS